MTAECFAVGCTEGSVAEGAEDSVAGGFVATRL